MRYKSEVKERWRATGKRRKLHGMSFEASRLPLMGSAHARGVKRSGYGRPVMYCLNISARMQRPSIDLFITDRSWHAGHDQQQPEYTAALSSRL